MHQVGLAKPHASVDEQGIVDLPWGLGHSQGCGVGQVVVGAYHEGVKGIPWV